MKLVDILARELKAWPAPKSLLSGSTDYCCQSDNTTEVYFGHGRTPIFLSKRAEDTEGVRVTRAEWQAAVDALNAPKAVDDFDGAPDDATHYGVGLTCKFWLKRVDGRWSFINIWGCANGDWHEASDKDNEWIDSREIIARDQSTSEWSEDGLPNIGTKCVIYKGSWQIRETAEQFIGPVVTVAARFKTSTGTEMAAIDGGPDLGCEVFRADMCFHLPTAEEVARREREDAIEEMVAVAGMGSRKACAALYDKNYRKKVTK